MNTRRAPHDEGGDGYWNADIAPTAIGSKYHFRIVNGDMSQCRMMKGMTDSEGKSAGPAIEHQQEHK